jgi:diadenosine tetraphosphatase ApaH/serine/threonine PP2A family protein phosphatase
MGTFQNFRSFVRSQYEGRHNAKRYYGSFEAFYRHYIGSFNFLPWIESMRGATLSLGATNHIVRMYIVHGERTPEDIARILPEICRMYDIQFPLEEGIFTPEYWQAKALRMGWIEEVREVA